MIVLVMFGFVVKADESKTSTVRPGSHKDSVHENQVFWHPTLPAFSGQKGFSSAALSPATLLQPIPYL